jgi:hypothetical protein
VRNSLRVIFYAIHQEHAFEFTFSQNTADKPKPRINYLIHQILPLKKSKILYFIIYLHFHSTFPVYALILIFRLYA